MSQHKNDTYGRIDFRSEDEEGVQPPIPAATVVLLRDGAADVEVLMLRKSSKITFGGMWVFPGGRIDDEDFAASQDEREAANNAVVRETLEETGIQLPSDRFAWFAHWTPPPGPQKRFATWFFATHLASDAEIAVDGGEIEDHQWLSAKSALAKHAQEEIDLAPPTWVTLHQISLFENAATGIQHFRDTPARTYQTRVAKRADGVRVAMWDGDAGYADWDANVAGARHRLVMSPGGFQFENTVVDYGVRPAS